MTVSIGFWNINGLGKDKYEDPDFRKIIQNYDILCLTETWREDGKNESNSRPPQGYREKRHNRKQKNKKAKRNSGGISVIYKSFLHDFIKVVDGKDENILWLKIDKKGISSKQDLLLGAVYISPKDSTVHKAERATNTFEVLSTQIEAS